MTETEIAALLRKPAITIPQAAEILNISRGSGYTAAKRGELEIVQFGKRKLVITAALRRKLGLEGA